MKTPKPKHPTRAQMVRAAQCFIAQEGIVEIEDNAKVSRARKNQDKGAYVEAWVWVDDDEAISLDE